MSGWKIKNSEKMIKNKDLWYNYCRRLTEHCSKINVLSNHLLGESSVMSVDKLYVPLEFEHNDDIVKSNEIDKSKNIIFCGKPGCGKSIFFLQKASEIANEFINDNASFAVIPLIILPHYFVKYNNRVGLIENLLINLKSQIKEMNLEAIPTKEDLEFLCKNGNLIILFDGINEAGDGKLNEQIRIFSKNYPNVRLWFTMRFFNNEDEFKFNRSKCFYRNDFYEKFHLPQKSNFDIFYFNGFDLKQICKFIRNWYKIRCFDVRESSELSETLISSINGNERLFKLSSNPLNLFLICMLHRNFIRLPDSKDGIFDLAVNTILEGWEIRKYKNVINANNQPKIRIARLKYLAYHMAEIENKGELITKDKIEYILKKHILEEYHYRNKEKEAELESGNFFHYLKTRSGIMSGGRGGNNFSFFNRTFREYLADSYLNENKIK